MADGRWLIGLLPFVFLLLFYFYPLLTILGLSFAPSGRIDLAALRELVSTSYYLRVVWFTTWQAAVSTLLTVALALPGAYVFARYEFPGKALVQALTTVPFVLPTMVVALAFTALVGPRGVLNSILIELLGLDRQILDESMQAAALLRLCGHCCRTRQIAGQSLGQISRAPAALPPLPVGHPAAGDGEKPRRKLGPAGVVPVPCSPRPLKDVGSQILSDVRIAHPVQAVVEQSMNVLLIEMGKSL